MFLNWPLPDAGQWTVSLYHTLLRVLILSTITGVAAFAFRYFGHVFTSQKRIGTVLEWRIASKASFNLPLSLLSGT